MYLYHSEIMKSTAKLIRSVSWIDQSVLHVLTHARTMLNRDFSASTWSNGLRLEDFCSTTGRTKSTSVCGGKIATNRSTLPQEQEHVKIYQTQG
jgi:hypothetical protein